MNRHKCRLCSKTFPNPKSLGGHMKSHMSNSPIARSSGGVEGHRHPTRVCEDTESASATCSSPLYSSEDEREGGDKRSVATEVALSAQAGSVILQDGGSETDSSRNPARRRSERIRKPELFDHKYKKFREDESGVKKLRRSRITASASAKTESLAEPEPVSSISDETTEEDLAVCLMMLSRDKWRRVEQQEEPEYEEDDEEEEEEVETEEFKWEKTQTRGKFKCQTCNKVFKSYQALGGHRASHKKSKACGWSQAVGLPEHESAAAPTYPVPDKPIHECPVCFRVFSSGQALGGHKRSHGSVSVEANFRKFPIKESFIDLNLPPTDEDMMSAVSDAEFLNRIKRWS